MIIDNKVTDIKTVKSCNELTAVEEHKGILYKRDDLFMPFDDIMINGGKVRQAISLIANNINHIKKECNSTISTASSVESPQGIIIGRVAKEFGLKSILAVGGGTDAEKLINKHPLLKASQYIGTEIRAVNKLGYNSVLYSKLKEMQKTEPMFIALFGINADRNFESILGTTIQQVNNLPLNLINRVIVPVGSALMFSAIIMGLKDRGWLDKKDNKVIGIQIAGVDRKKTIDGLLSKRYFMQNVPYELILDKTYKYSTYVKSNIVDTDIELDCIYEAKAHEYALKNNLLKEGGLFWVVGNSNLVRKQFGKEIK